MSEEKLNPLEKLRIRMAAEGYQSFNNPETTDEETGDVPKEAKEKSGSQRKGSGGHGGGETFLLYVLLLVALAAIVCLAVLLVVQHLWLSTGKECTSPACVDVGASMLRLMDLSADPCEDFYQYACGYIERDPLIPPDKAKWGAFAQVDRTNQAIVKRLLDTEGAEYKGVESSAVKKVKQYYKVCMNQTERDAHGNSPMYKLISSLGSWPVAPGSESGTWQEEGWSLERTIAKAHMEGSSALFGMSVGQDDKNSSLNRIVFDQSGLTFSNYKNYIGNDTDKYKKAFIDYFTGVATLLGADEKARQQAQDVWDFEVKLAGARDRPEDRQDARLLYHLMTQEQLQELCGDTVDLLAYLNAVFPDPVTATEHVLVYAPKYFRKMAAIVKDTPKQTLANYAVWHVVQSLVSYLPAAFDPLHDALRRALTGVEASPPRWETCTSRAASALGFAVGALFVQDNFSPQDKINSEKILAYVRRTFEGQLPELEWMDAATKQAALDKAAAVVQKIGYPEYIQDPAKLDDHYRKMDVGDSGFDNALNSVHFAVAKNLAKRNKAPDFSEWEMTPSEVNAYYSPDHNQIVFPAGILKRPFYDPNFPWAVNFGAAGMVMGHELTHGFDSSGRLYDKHGNLNNWWANASAERFEKKTKCLVDQYSSYEVEGAGHLNGITTLGENIADNGGLKTSFRAYQSWLQDNRYDDPRAALPALNMTRDQLFFLGFAQMWCTYYTPEYAKQSLVVDPHSYAKYRVIGSVSNLPEFSETFKCGADAKMNPADKCSIW